MSLQALKKELQEKASPEKAEVSRRFFKTGKGQYGEGDVFIGVTVPESRKISRKFKDLHYQEVTKLLQSKIHEERLVALLLLVHNFQVHQEKQQEIVDFYLDHAQYINNWDLVDLSADKILGAFLADKDKSVLYTLAQSESLWERRIAIIATFHFIKQGDFDDTFKIAEILMNDSHDLIHKAVGWMLREVGNRDHGVEDYFLRDHYKSMPRTMLRYAIEKFPEMKRKAYLQGKV